jgi:hypothetical protein
MCENSCHFHYQDQPLTEGCFAKLRTLKKYEIVETVNKCSVKCCHQTSAARTVNMSSFRKI